MISMFVTQGGLVHTFWMAQMNQTWQICDSRLIRPKNKNQKKTKKKKQKVDSEKKISCVKWLGEEQQ